MDVLVGETSSRSRKRVRFEDSSEGYKTQSSKRPRIDAYPFVVGSSTSTVSGGQSSWRPSLTDGSIQSLPIDEPIDEEDFEDDPVDFDIVSWQKLLRRLIQADSLEDTEPFSSSSEPSSSTAMPSFDDRASIPTTSETPATLIPPSIPTIPEIPVPSITPCIPTAESTTVIDPFDDPNVSWVSHPLLPPNVLVPTDQGKWPLVLQSFLREHLGGPTPFRDFLRSIRPKWPQVVAQVLGMSEEYGEFGRREGQGVRDVEEASSGVSRHPQSSWAGHEDWTSTRQVPVATNGAGGNDDEEEEEEEWSEESDEDIDEVLARRAVAQNHMERIDELDSRGHWEVPSLPVQDISSDRHSLETSGFHPSVDEVLDDRAQRAQNLVESRDELDPHGRWEFLSLPVESSSSGRSSPATSNFHTLESDHCDNCHQAEQTMPESDPVDESYSDPSPSIGHIHAVSPAPRSNDDTNDQASDDEDDDEDEEEEQTKLLLSSYRCPICLSPPRNATLTPCGHIICGACLFQSIKASGYVPPLADEVGDVVAAGARQFDDAEGDDRLPVIYDGQGRRWRWRYRMNERGGDRGRIFRERVLDNGDREPRCPVCRSVIHGWNGKGMGVVGLKVQVEQED
ncbi:hypothetical protein D9758_013867 [Tetrapyrgos nigripes]|uniref:RING-type domain-containing protein n=1 Tax=Tetrapyrgos nigripes TaxID=182062 RepID=A0A8H5CRC9_9AGAR|nr:hypothetical protein D9758_013867 [Tetrapyrgos nigripes]